MRKDWTETTLGDVAEVIMGRQLSPSKKLGTRPRSYLRAANIGNWGISLNDVMQMDFTENEENYFASRTGDVLMVEGGNEKSVGCPALVTEREQGLCIQNTVIRCRVKDTTQLSSEFLYHSLRHNFWVGKFGELCAGTTIMHLGQKRAVVFPLVVPPLAEQKRIVDVVSSVDSYIDALQRQVDSARAARNAVSHELLTAGGDDWTETTLGPLVTLITGKLDVNAGVEEGEFPFFTCSRDTYKIDVAAYSGKSVIVAGNGDLNVKYYEGEFNAYQRTYILQAINESVLNPVFLFHFMEKYVDTLRNDTQGSTIQYLKKGQFTEAPIVLPPLAEQERIVEIVSSMDDVVQSTEQAVVDAKNLRSGLLSDLLSGEHEIPASYDSLLGAA